MVQIWLQGKEELTQSLNSVISAFGLNVSQLNVYQKEISTNFKFFSGITNCRSNLGHLLSIALQKHRLSKIILVQIYAPRNGENKCLKVKHFAGLWYKMELNSREGLCTFATLVFNSIFTMKFLKDCWRTEAH